MIVPFLRGDGVVLAAPEPPDVRAVEPMRWTLARAAGHADGLEHEIRFAVRDAASGAFVARVALERIDWVARSARVTHRGERLPEALALVARYAFHELALATLDAEPADHAAEMALRDAGFAQDARGQWSARSPVRHPW